LRLRQKLRLRQRLTLIWWYSLILLARQCLYLRYSLSNFLHSIGIQDACDDHTPGYHVAYRVTSIVYGGTWRYQRGRGQGQAGRVAHEACIYTVLLGQGAHGHWQGVARHGMAWHGTAWRCQSRQGKAGILHKRTAELDGTSTYSPNSCRAAPAARHTCRDKGRKRQRGEEKCLSAVQSDAFISQRQALLVFSWVVY
jgi:hypothetical protein